MGRKFSYDFADRQDEGGMDENSSDEEGEGPYPEEEMYDEEEELLDEEG